MNPWTKEIRAIEVIGWMFDENPDIWYTPAAVTDVNPAYPKTKLKIEDATAVFEELGARGLIRRVYPVVHVGTGPHAEPVTIPAWETDKNRTGEIWDFRRSGWFGIYIVSMFRFLWGYRSRPMILLISALGIFITGLLSQAGEDVWTLIWGWFNWPKVR